MFLCPKVDSQNIPELAQLSLLLLGNYNFEDIVLTADSSITPPGPQSGCPEAAARTVNRCHAILARAMSAKWIPVHHCLSLHLIQF